MANLNVRFSLAITSRMARWIIAGLCLGLMALEVSPESITLSTYYPAPSGIYVNMVTTADTHLARDTGAVTVGTLSGPAASNVILGVNGVAQFGNFSSPPTGTCKNGSIYYDTDLKIFQGCVSAKWQPLGSIPAFTSYSCGWAGTGARTDVNMGSAQLCVLTMVGLHSDGSCSDGSPYCSACMIYQPSQSGNPNAGNWDLRCDNVAYGCVALCLGDSAPSSPSPGGPSGPGGPGGPSGPGRPGRFLTP